ncbi:hypothetical protein FPANT_13874 [Fusarium pseudoanthophilum]|uniref:Uncharacterized protein n=1 Tax=Fusarium pseudoanthophilum TaxID=48495 RepID=A0A8H5KAS7_9HYPO|nr:hypothetical protein FPANT_13874 [Fusarium pseudoanthophilum]
MNTPNLGEWLTAASTGLVGFGHYKYESSIVDASEVWSGIFDSLISQKAPNSLIVISPGVKHRRDPILRGFEKSGQNVANFQVMSYTAWAEYIQNCWSTAGPTLKDYSIVVIDLDPSMTIECAMALLLATHFVMDMAENSMTRLITVSCTEVDHAFERLADHLGLPKPMTFPSSDIEDPSPEDQQTIYCESVSELVERFRDRTEHQEGNHIALVYNSQRAADALEFDNTATSETLMSNEAMENHLLSGGCERLSVSIPDGSHTRIALSGYKHIHMVVQPKTLRASFDLSVGQTTTFHQLLSFEERIELRSVLRRLKERPVSATLYVLGEEKKKGEWWRTGPAIRRKDVWNRSLGAFMTLVAALGPRVDAAAAVECFVPEGMLLIYRTTQWRLKTHGILKWNTDGRLILGLERYEMEVFRKVLPFVGSDYRLAYFIAQGFETGSGAMIQTKIQLAAVVNSGGVAMFDFQEVLPDSIDTMHDLVDACTGYSKPLTDQGSMWLALGLWKRLADHTDNFQTTTADGRLQFPDNLSLTGEKLRCIKAQDSLRHMLSALGIQTRQDQYSDEPILSESDCHDIQSHLFRAYLSQLVSCYRGINGDRKVEFLDLSSKRRVRGLVEGGVDTFHHGNVPNGAPAFGVYHGLRRYNDGILEFEDFTFIPSGLVADWVWAFRDRVGEPTFRIESMLTVAGGPRPNYDGMSDEVWNPEKE